MFRRSQYLVLAETQSSSPCPGERVRKPTRPHPSNQTATGEPVWPSLLEAAGLGSSGPDGDRLAVVAGGVTSTQGMWESHMQGEGPEA